MTMSVVLVRLVGRCALLRFNDFRQLGVMVMAVMFTADDVLYQERTIHACMIALFCNGKH
jgi:hypothetical protein